MIVSTRLMRWRIVAKIALAASIILTFWTLIIVVTSLYLSRTLIKAGTISGMARPVGDHYIVEVPGNGRTLELSRSQATLLKADEDIVYRYPDGRLAVDLVHKAKAVYLGGLIFAAIAYRIWRDLSRTKEVHELPLDQGRN